MPERRWVGGTEDWGMAANWLMNENNANGIHGFTMGFDPGAQQGDGMAWAAQQDGNYFTRRRPPDPINVSIPASTLSPLFGALMSAYRDRREIHLEGVHLTEIGTPHYDGTAEVAEFYGQARRLIAGLGEDTPRVQEGVAYEPGPRINPTDPDLIAKCRKALQDAGLIPGDTRGMDFAVRHLIHKAIGGPNVPGGTE